MHSYNRPVSSYNQPPLNTTTATRWTDFFRFSRAPVPPQVDDSSSSYTDLDGEHLKSEANETAQATKEKTSEAAQTGKEKGSEAAQTAREKASAAADYTKEKSSQFADSASTNYNKAKKEAKKDGKKAKEEIKGEYNEVYENRDNPVVIANGIAIVVGAAALGYGAYSKHQVGELTWQVAGVAAAVVGVLGIGDYYLSQ